MIIVDSRATGKGTSLVVSVWIPVLLLSGFSIAFGFHQTTTKQPRASIFSNKRIPSTTTSLSMSQEVVDPETAGSSETTALLSTTTTTHKGRMVQEKTKAELRGKNVLLTGASGGLGRAFALQLAECQVANLVLSARKEEDLLKVAAECQQAIAPGAFSSISIHCITGDLSDPASVDALAKQALEKCNGKVDVLINNGGVSSRSRFVDTSWEVDQKCMQINFLSGAALAKAVVPGMVENNNKSGGRILWISSVQGLMGIPNRSSYAASKFAVQGYCEALRAELASSGVTVHTVSPGYIRTNLSRSALTGDGGTHGVMDATTEQGAEPNELAASILDRVVVKGENDFIIAAGFSATVALWMRMLCPGILQKILVKRYEKSLDKEKEEV